MKTSGPDSVYRGQCESIGLDSGEKKKKVTLAWNVLEKPSDCHCFVTIYEAFIIC